MSFTPNHKKSDKQFSISLKSQSGNTIGFINLTSQFLRAMSDKQVENITVGDILALNNGDFEDYILSAEVHVEEVAGNGPTIEAKDF